MSIKITFLLNVSRFKAFYEYIRERNEISGSDYIRAVLKFLETISFMRVLFPDKRKILINLIYITIYT